MRDRHFEITRRRDFLELILFAIGLRATLFLIVCVHYHYTFHQWAMRDDGSSYIAYARALLGDSSHLTEYDQRVFPGYPALIAIVHRLGIPIDAAAVGVTWVSAGLVAALAAALFRDRRIGWAMACLPLQYFINSSLTMSEAPMLALALIGLLLANRGKIAGGGILLGLAGLVRPMACFAVLGQLLRSMIEVPKASPIDPTTRSSPSIAIIAAGGSSGDPRLEDHDLSFTKKLAPVPGYQNQNSPRLRSLMRRYRAPIILALTSASVVALGILALHHWTGDAFRGARVYANAPNTYNGHLIQWPFHSLIHESLRPEVSAARVFYIWLHVSITFIALAIVLFRCLRDRTNADGRDLLAAPWLAGNTLFVLSIGSFWGFEHFPRFTIPALPAMFWALRNFLPRRKVFWLGIAAVILVSASLVVLHNFVIVD
ncbi:MAG TPA: hypothetical protein VFE47_13870 [Tepidisphaeraceae bacterium]|jgi:hypothetical protein|nr:hypothetical protein [Tepidisphaeraceae bacterium]